MIQSRIDNGGLLSPLLADGRPFLTLGSLGLFFSGGFALFLAATGQFLPHDTAFLGMTAKELCSRDGCKIVHFMIHDRVAFGGTLLAIATLYLWLIHFPLRRREPWAWWALLISNLAGFGSFLTYLGFGYLDTWHAIASLFLLPCFGIGLALMFRTLGKPRSVRSVFVSGVRPGRWTSPASLGRLLLLATAAGMLIAGVVICVVGMTVVFVPEDLEYMEATAPILNALNPHLIPLIAHDRAGFGGGIFNAGFLILICTWCGKPSRNLWQALGVAGVFGFGTAIGIHPIVGYNNPVHLAPACAAGLAFALGLVLCARTMLARFRGVPEYSAP